MVTRTFLDKCTTIVSGSSDNFGLNPIGMLNYGNIISRCLIHFDISKIKEALGEDEPSDKIKHYLNLTNCGSIDLKDFGNKVPSNDFNGEKERATSFTIIAIELPNDWDAGVGFDNSDDFWLIGKSVVSQNGANWFQSQTGFVWKEKGIFTTKQLQDEYDLFRNGEKSLVVAEQHFDRGNENFHMDITNYVNELINGKENYGLCLAFIPTLETSSPEYTQYVGFFTNNTNTFYVPFVETRYNEPIADDRDCFYSGMDNKLYFLANFDGILDDLDKVPTCTINDEIYPVKRQKKGVYYADVKLKARDNEILYDNWSDIVYKGNEFSDIENEFIVKTLNIRSIYTNSDEIAEPILYGINDNEKVNQGDNRVVTIRFVKPYTSKDIKVKSPIYYRIYIKDGEREVDVIDWDIVDKLNGQNWFVINTDELLPSTYYVDIRCKIGDAIRTFKDKLHFKIMQNITNIKK